MSASSEIKSLEQRIKRLRGEIDQHYAEKATRESRINELKLEINKARERLDALSQVPSVSEHAILRYLERVMGVDTEKVVEAILTPGNKKIIEFAGDCTIKANGINFVVKNRRVVSVVTE